MLPRLQLPLWVKVLFSVVFIVRIFSDMALSSTVLSIIILLAMDMASLNFNDPAGSRNHIYCRCYSCNHTLEKRVEMMANSFRLMAEAPEILTVSLAAHSIGKTLGWVVGRPNVRFPLDMFVYEYFDAKTGCIYQNTAFQGSCEQSEAAR